MGLRRSNNEDSYLCLPERGIFAVADGLGGLEHGELASGTLVKLIEEAPDELLDDLNLFARSSNEVIHEKGVEMGAKTIGTTMTLAILNGASMKIVHVGDSVAYLLREEGVLEQLTEEQTVAQKRLERGEPVERYMHHVLTQCMGQAQPVVPQILEVAFPAGAKLLLCSDGITKTVQDEYIEEVLKECESPQEAVKTLIDMANRAGGPDNSTAVVVFA